MNETLQSLFRKTEAETVSFRFGLVCFVFFNWKVWGRVLYRGKYLMRQNTQTNEEVLYKLATESGKRCLNTLYLLRIKQ